MVYHQFCANKCVVVKGVCGLSLVSFYVGGPTTKLSEVGSSLKELMAKWFGLLLYEMWALMSLINFWPTIAPEIRVSLGFPTQYPLRF